MEISKNVQAPPARHRQKCGAAAEHGTKLCITVPRYGKIIFTVRHGTGATATGNLHPCL